MSAARPSKTRRHEANRPSGRTTASAARPSDSYRRDSVTRAAFGALFGFGFLNAVLGPALPYIRATEHISYVIGALHQVAYAIGGGLAGLLATRRPASVSRRPLSRWDWPARRSPRWRSATAPLPRSRSRALCS